MRYLIDVWTKPWLELSAIDQTVMALEGVALLFLIAIGKVWVVDEIQRRRRRARNDVIR